MVFMSTKAPTNSFTVVHELRSLVVTLDLLSLKQNNSKNYYLFNLRKGDLRQWKYSCPVSLFPPIPSYLFSLFKFTLNLLINRVYTVYSILETP